MARKRQKPLTGMEQTTIPEVDSAADSYHEAKIERSKLAAEEKELKEKLIETMETHGLECYETPDGVIVRMSKTVGCKTKRRPKVQDVDNQVEVEVEE